MLAAIVMLALAGGVPPASAHGDPASHVLEYRTVYFPYTARGSAETSRLQDLVYAAQNGGYEVRVALISDMVDLGSASDLLGKPQAYAEFLGRKFHRPPAFPLLVVMRNGYGVVHGGTRADRVLARLKPPASKSADDLAAAATVAVRQLAAAAGRPVREQSGQPAPAARREPIGPHNEPSWMLFVAPAALVALAVSITTLRGRGRTSPSTSASTVRSRIRSPSPPHGG